MTFDELQAQHKVHAQSLAASQHALVVSLSALEQHVQRNVDLQARNSELQTHNDSLQSRIESVEQQLDWFKRQLFGPKSERRGVDLNPEQLALFQSLVGEAASQAPAPTVDVPAHSRKTQRSGDEVNDQGLRFDDDVPIETITLSNAVLKGQDADQYEIIAWKASRRLASVPGTTVVLEYRRPVIKRKGSDELITTPAPDGPLGYAQVDVSFLAQMAVDKFCYHTPLYRQHQKLKDAGVTLARSTLERWMHQSISLLTPIAQAVMTSILGGEYIKVDETPIKFSQGKNKQTGRGKMKQGWFWPVMGEDGSIAFHFSPERGKRVLDELIGNGFAGTLQSDGYGVYARYTAQHEPITHALCWSHTRRAFLKAENTEPEAIAHVLTQIRALYAIERELRETGADTEKILQARETRSRPIVDSLFEWIDEQRQRADLLPKSEFAKALHYAAKREAGLRVFLEEACVELDTNDLERGLRVIPMGKKNWLFAMSEVGAEHIATIQTLLASCRAHDVNPYHYLVDVLQRVDVHPAKDIAELTPAQWKKTFTEKRFVSPLAIAQQAS